MKRRRSQSSESRVPLWVVEGFDIAEQRRIVLLGVAVALSVVGAVLSVLAPGIVPPRALVGAAVGVAALMLGYAAAVAVDAADLTVWGPRHVRAAGGEVVAIVPTEATLADARPLARAVLDARDGEERVLLGVAAAGREHRLVSAWSEAVATALAEEGVSVLFVDLAVGRSDEPGLYEVVDQGLRIGSVAEIDEELLLARLGAGSDLTGALAAVRSLPERLPRDLDVLLLSLPTAASREVVEAAAAALDHVLLVAERGTTARVDLIAALDALEGTGTSAQAVLADDRTVSRMTGRSATEAGTATGAFTAAASPPASEARGEEEIAVAGAPSSESPGGDDDEHADEAETHPEGPEALGDLVEPAPVDEPAISTRPDEPEIPSRRNEPDADAEGGREPRAPEAVATSERDGATEVPVEARAPEVLGAARAALAAYRTEQRAQAADPQPSDLQPPEDRAFDPEPSAGRVDESRTFESRPSDTEPIERRTDEASHAHAPAPADDEAEATRLTSAMPTPERVRPPEEVPDLEPAEPAEPGWDVAPEEADTDTEDPLVTTAQLAILVDELEDRRGEEEDLGPA